MNEISVDETVEYESAKQELDRIYDHIADGCILCSKAWWYEEKEKASKYILSLEKRNKVKSCIRRLRNPSDSDKYISDPRKNSEELKNFYENLYRRTSVKTEVECFQHLEKLNTPTLTPDEQSLCEGKLILQECWEALTSMQNGKSPGNDGFMKEFYVALFGELGKLLVSVFNYAIEVGEFSWSQKQAVKTLIQEKDRDMLIKNWTQISLINVDIKIA